MKIKPLHLMMLANGFLVASFLMERYAGKSCEKFLNRAVDIAYRATAEAERANEAMSNLMTWKIGVPERPNQRRGVKVGREPLTGHTFGPDGLGTAGGRWLIPWSLVTNETWWTFFGDTGFLRWLEAPPPEMLMREIT